MDADISKARTRAFARFLGPFIVIVPGVIALRAQSMGEFVGSFFANAALVWIMGGILLAAGLFIIAFHQYWRSPAAVIISLFGWFLAIRGIMLLAAPQLIENAARASQRYIPLARIGFGALVLAGLWLTYVGWIARPAPNRPA